MRGEKTASGERFALYFHITAFDRYPCRRSTGGGSGMSKGSMSSSLDNTSSEAAPGSRSPETTMARKMRPIIK
jgi:hypothetical protein